MTTKVDPPFESIITWDTSGMDIEWMGREIMNTRTKELMTITAVDRINNKITVIPYQYPPTFEPTTDDPITSSSK